MKSKRIYSYVDERTDKFIEREAKKAKLSKASFIDSLIQKEMNRGKVKNKTSK